MIVKPRIPAWVIEDLPPGEHRDELIARYERRYAEAVEHWTKVLLELGHDGEWIVTNSSAQKRGDTVQAVASPYELDWLAGENELERARMRKRNARARLLGTAYEIVLYATLAATMLAFTFAFVYFWMGY